MRVLLVLGGTLLAGLFGGLFAGLFALAAEIAVRGAVCARLRLGCPGYAVAVAPAGFLLALGLGLWWVRR